MGFMDAVTHILEFFVQIMQLVNQIIYGNIYNNPEEDDAEVSHSSPESRSLREGTLLLHRGGLASFKWVKYGSQSRCSSTCKK